MQSSFTKVSVFGLGYIGLPTAAVLANRSVDVIGVDVNPQIVNTINKGQIHIVEPELDVMVRGAVATGRLRATTIPEEADAFIIAVPTPLGLGNVPDLSYIKNAANSVAKVLKKGDLVVLESTSPVGTTEKLASWLAVARPDLGFPHQLGREPDIQVAYCPERVLPGHILREITDNDRILGGMTEKCALRTETLYKIFVRGRCILTNTRTAELTKLAENAFRDVNIAFANEISVICDRLHIDTWELIELANLHPRVNILQPGPGVGGHCIAVDPWFIIDSVPDLTQLIMAARKVNDNKPEYVFSRITEKARHFDSPVIACLGLAFKADIDDLRESPALQIVEALARMEDNIVLVVEPNIDVLPEILASFSNVELVDLQTSLEKADVVVLLVNHREFFQVDVLKLKEKVIIDTRGVLARFKGKWPVSRGTL